MFAEEPPCHGKHPLPYFPAQVLLLLAVGVEAESQRDMLHQMPFLVVERVLELRRRRCEADYHDTLVRAPVGVGKPRVEPAPHEAGTGPAQFRAVAADVREVAHYVVCPISRDGVVDADVPAVSGQHEVLHYHSTSSHSMGFPPPMQSAM